ncbi:hypothetical protein ACHHYP_04644 [Achlya hypogyna]|uniref:WW domain-containing protein n=1 Tax=Achlya hypogyna TaxID=1202772 RepID=A0A1V9ZP29_ACHHY|nr:hypothetical protein ACHHYP_04644 [Achlya hypogyna]
MLEWIDFVEMRRRARQTAIRCLVLMSTSKQANAFDLLRAHAMEDVAASEIQRIYRGMRGRIRYLSVLGTYEAAVAIQRIYRQRGDFLKYLKRLRMQSRFAIKIQRAYRGRLGRIVARKTLIAYFHAEMAKLQSERQAFYDTVRDQAVRRLQRFCRKCRRQVEAKKADDNTREIRRVELEMQALLDTAARQKAEHRCAVTEYYDTLREQTLATEARQKIDNKSEKQKVTLLRRRREWETILRQRSDAAAAKELAKATQWTQFEAEWSAKVESRAELLRAQLEEILLRPNSKEQDSIKADLDRRTNDHFKALRRILHDGSSSALRKNYKASAIAMDASEIRERARHNVIEEDMEAERDRVREEWRRAALMYKQQEQEQADRERKAEIQEENTRKFKAATCIQRGAKVCLARRLLCRKVEAIFLKEYDVPSASVVYRNLRTGTLCPKPRCLGSKDIPLLDKWYIVPDITGDMYYYNPKQMRQSWTKPEACVFCEECSDQFAQVFCPHHRKGAYADPAHLCNSCFAIKLAQDANVARDATEVDGARVA